MVDLLCECMFSSLLKYIAKNLAHYSRLDENRVLANWNRSMICSEKKQKHKEACSSRPCCFSVCVFLHCKSWISLDGRITVAEFDSLFNVVGKKNVSQLTVLRSDTIRCKNLYFWHLSVHIGIYGTTSSPSYALWT